MSDPHDNAIVQPRHTTVHRRRVAERILLFPLCPHLQAFLARGGYDRRDRRAHPSWYYYPPPSPEKPGVAGRFVGAPHLTIVVEELIALGARELVFFGIAGALEDSAHVGERLLVESAFADEGVSSHYAPNKKVFSASPELLQRLEKHFVKLEKPIRRVTGWTTDAIYRETPEKIHNHLAAGRAIVDMEISALYCIAAYRGISAVGIVVVSDRVRVTGWQPAFYDPRFRWGVTQTIKALSTW